MLCKKSQNSIPEILFYFHERVNKEEIAGEYHFYFWDLCKDCIVQICRDCKGEFLSVSLS